MNETLPTAVEAVAIKKSEAVTKAINIGQVRLPVELLHFYYDPSDKRIYSYDGGVILSLDNETQSTYGAFSCCGARTMSSFGRCGLDTEKGKQNFVATFLNARGEYQSWYYIVAGYQFGKPAGKKDLFYEPGLYGTVALFDELGATEIDSRPNRYHGPENMHLRVWTPLDNKKNIEKFVRNIQTTKRGGGFDAILYTWEPLWWLEMSDEDRTKYIQDHQKEIEINKQRRVEYDKREEKQRIDAQYWDAYRFFQFAQPENIKRWKQDFQRHLPDIFKEHFK